MPVGIHSRTDSPAGTHRLCAGVSLWKELPEPCWGQHGQTLHLPLLRMEELVKLLAKPREPVKLPAAQHPERHARMGLSTWALCCRSSSSGTQRGCRKHQGSCRLGSPMAGTTSGLHQPFSTLFSLLFPDYSLQTITAVGKELCLGLSVCRIRAEPWS